MIMMVMVMVIVAAVMITMKNHKGDDNKNVENGRANHDKDDLCNYLAFVVYRPASSVAKKIVCERYNWSIVSACSRKDDEDMTRKQADTSWTWREIGMHCRNSKGQRRRRGHGDAGGGFRRWRERRW